jgi:hypothetical protein
VFVVGKIITKRTKGVGLITMVRNYGLFSDKKLLKCFFCVGNEFVQIGKPKK